MRIRVEINVEFNIDELATVLVALERYQQGLDPATAESKRACAISRQLTFWQK